MQKIRLERITPDDAQAFFDLAHSDEVVPSPIAQFLPSYVQDFKSTREMVNEFAGQHNGRSMHYYMIKDGKLSVGFVSAEFSRVYPKGFYITYFLGEQYRGKHYMSIALDRLFDILSEFNIPCIFEVSDANLPSKHVVEKISITLNL